MGHLGNQLFQYAALVCFSKAYNFDHVIPTSTEGRDIHLDKCFNITAPRTSNFSFLKQRFTEDGFPFNDTLQSVPDNTDLMGYFQSDLYFKHCQNGIRRELTFRREIQEEARTKYQNKVSSSFDTGVYKQEKTVGIHVRRGDYLKFSDCHPPQSEEYYKAAIGIFGKKQKFLVFSDDIEWCKQSSVFKGDNFVFMEGNNQYVDLCLMTMCNHHIIANSSFSWWGAWLGASKDQTVVAPGHWFGPSLYKHDLRDLYPTGWIVIDERAIAKYPDDWNIKV
tara:strand:+ start:1892 stop:2725 length:834 start_codon:yes stop_codon:yes gene_type:complete